MTNVGASLAAKTGMPDMSSMFQMSAANLIGGFVFGSIGFVAFVYGKRMNLWKTMFCGLALMIFPYFISSTVAVFVIGTCGSVALLFFRE